MRLARKGLRALTVRKPLGGEGQKREWLEGGQEIRAHLQPYGATRSSGPMQALAAVYGERIVKMLTLHYTGLLKLAARDGVCVDVAHDASCDYEVVSVMQWPQHQQAVIEWIPEGKRK